MTSHDVVAKLRRGLKLKKVGHAGTLDPMATGVLIICIGGATRLSEYVMASTKHYRTRIRLGVTTDTYDAEGEILQTRDPFGMTREHVEEALGAFRGNIQQVPPMYSAIKQGGRKLYDLARAGETVERQPRSVMIERLEMTDWSLPELTLDVVCSAGTYIRSLAYDLGEALGVGAHLTGLVRSASGAFMLEQAITLDDLLNDANWSQYLIDPPTALAQYPFVHLTPTDVENIRHGRAVPGADVTEDQIAFAYDPTGQLVAVLTAFSGLWRPHKVFSIQE
ncbi:MAG: tRNA pseudouridine(55) synthase TruB [Anaerolineae bacterium]|nr:tRNA pseudouridine(55) synthase TruB [Anaerolineae bacterium]